MSTLFDTDSSRAGWRLNYLEIYNWGSFHDKIHRIMPQGRNSLLTGANGSGKTTIVDALITLLVPPNKRHYNQSSGIARKKERDELSYVLGAFGTMRDEESLSGTTQYLRNKEGYSFLLACFINEGFQQGVSLAQVRWFSSGNIKRLYLLSNSALEIDEDFASFDAAGIAAWKKRLSSHHPVKFFDSFILYEQAFSSLFGLRSEKALWLFSHVVGVKVLGDLNDFIRDNVLESNDMQEDFSNLKKNYEDLLGTHTQIEKAREQLKFLNPVVEKAKLWEELCQQKTVLDQACQAIIPVFSEKEKELLHKVIQKEEEKLLAFDSRRLTFETELESLRHQERELELSLYSHNSSEFLQGLDQEEAHRKTLLGTKEKRLSEYSSLLLNLGLNLPKTEEDFWALREEILYQNKILEENQSLLVNTWADLRQKLIRTEEQLEILQQEWHSLDAREGQIPRSLVDLRARLCQELGLRVDLLPFWGECVRVKDEAWQGALEFLLRPLALSLLVPSEYEKAVKNWVNEQVLTNTLRFFLLKDDGEEHFFVSQTKGLIEQFLDFRGPTNHIQSIRHHLNKFWDFIACSTFEELHHCSRGLQTDGWIHDQRLWTKIHPCEWNDPTNFVLGWDNSSKIRYLETSIRTLKTQQEDLQIKLQETAQERHLLDERRIVFEKILDFQNWSNLDPTQDKAMIADLMARRDQITRGNHANDALLNHLSSVRLSIKNQSLEKDHVLGALGRTRQVIEELTEKAALSNRILQNVSQQDLEKSQGFLEPWLQKLAIPPDLSSLSVTQDKITQIIRLELQQKIEKLEATERELEILMHRFIHPGQDYMQKFPEWTGEVSQLMAKTDYLKEFLALFERIQQEDLPGYQQRFKTWLNQRLIEDIADFKTSLENQQKGIAESVQELNSSLRTIVYNKIPHTFIQLHVEENQDAEIKAFRKMLREALKLDSDSDLEKAFHRIRHIIQSLSANELWRRKVTDVRNWLQFAVVEKYSADESQKQFYQDSQSLSGGEKAKLAYTILASAIAHQFSIRHDGIASRSFRFALVDEAFSKVDPENSRFAMNLFQQLNLQLMVVTPLDKINVVEDHIHTIHYVENKQRKTSSVYDLTIETYQGLRQGTTG